MKAITLSILLAVLSINSIFGSTTDIVKVQRDSVKLPIFSATIPQSYGVDEEFMVFISLNGNVYKCNIDTVLKDSREVCFVVPIEVYDSIKSDSKIDVSLCIMYDGGSALMSIFYFEDCIIPKEINKNIE
jgi:hypothetical protein